jgi:cell wall-associated NlpC family hydrolase
MNTRNRLKVTFGAFWGVSALTLLLLFAPRSEAAGTYTYTHLSDTPARTIVTDANGNWVATFTDGASTVTVIGPSRTFTESTAAAPVITTTWVRLLPTPFSGTVDATTETWLTQELADTSVDVLSTTMQYIEAALPITSGNLQIAGDANYGPWVTPTPLGTSTRAEGSDFNDYLQIPWNYGTITDTAEITEALSLDCSGFVRMVYGYRNGLPLTLTPNATAIPRKSFQILDSAPGVVSIPVSTSDGTPQGTPVVVPTAYFSRLNAGDIVFFDADTGDGTQIDHVCIYLGRDTAGHYRFISSRKSANGPTLGDTGGRSTLDGTSTYYWPKTFRAARRF